MCLTDASNRWGNVNSPQELMRIFIDGLDKTTKTIVARHSESHRRLTFHALEDYTQPEGGPVRARTGKTHRVLFDNRVVNPQTNRTASPPKSQTLHQRWTTRGLEDLLQSPVDSHESYFQEHHGPITAMHLLQEGDDEDPLRSEEPSVSQETQDCDAPQEPILLSERFSIHVSPVLYQDNRTKPGRPGCVNRPLLS